MNDLEQLVTEALRAHEREAPDGARLLAAVRRRIDRRRRVAWSVALVGATAVIVVAAVAVWTSRGQTSPPSVAKPAPTPSIPAGTQPVSFRGVDVFVPVTWKVNDTRCGTPLHDTVIVEDGSAVELCLITRPPEVRTVVLVEAADTPDGRALSTLATRHVTVDGRSGRRGRGTAAGVPNPVSVLVLPNPGVVVSVESRNPAVADRILDLVRVSDVDVFGCRAKVPSLVAVAPKHPRRGSGDHLVPGEPRDAVVCRYADNQLSRSVRLTVAEQAQMVATLNSLPVGMSQPGGGFGEDAASCAEDRRRGFIVQFRYADEPSVDVYVHIGGCQDLNASNGSRTTKINVALVDELTGAAGYDGGFPDPRELT